MATPEDPVSVAVAQRKTPFLSRLGERVEGLVIEFVGTIVAVGGIALTDRLVKWWLGEEKFFEVIPVQGYSISATFAWWGALYGAFFSPEKEGA